MPAAVLRIRDARDSDSEALVALWRACRLTRPWNDPYRDIERTRIEPSTRILISWQDDALVGSAMIGYDGHRGWVYYLAVAPAYRGLGYGAQLIGQAETHLLALGCPKLLMMARPGQPALVDYYQRFGYAEDEVVLVGKRLIHETDADTDL